MVSALRTRVSQTVCSTSSAAAASSRDARAVCHRIGRQDLHQLRHPGLVPVAVLREQPTSPGSQAVLDGLRPRCTPASLARASSCIRDEEGGPYRLTDGTLVVRSTVSRAARRRSTSATTRRARSSASPGGRVVGQCRSACRPGEELQQPTLPQVRQIRRCTVRVPSRTQSWQIPGPAGFDLGRGLRPGGLQLPAGLGGVSTGCSSVSWSARRVAMVSMDSSTSKAASTCSTTSWSMVPLDRIFSTSSRSTCSVCSRSRRYSSDGVSLSVATQYLPHRLRPGARSDRRAVPPSPGRRSAGPGDSSALEPGVGRGLQHGRRLQRVGPRVRSAQLQRPDQPRQGQTLQQQGARRDHHRGQDQHLPLRHVLRDQECGGQGDHTPQPGPADDQRRGPGGGTLPSRCHLRLNRKIRVNDDPDQPDHDHPDQDGHARTRRSARRTAPTRCTAVEDPACLQADQQEDRVLQQELDGGPVDPLAQPGLAGLDHRRLVAEDQPGGDHRDDARAVEVPDRDLLGRHVRGERHQERDGGVEHRLGDPAPDRDHHEGHQQARRAPRRRPRSGSRRSPRRPRRRRRWPRWPPAGR